MSNSAGRPPAPVPSCRTSIGGVSFKPPERFENVPYAPGATLGCWGQSGLRPPPQAPAAASDTWVGPFGVRSECPRPPGPSAQTLSACPAWTGAEKWYDAFLTSLACPAGHWHSRGTPCCRPHLKGQAGRQTSRPRRPEGTQQIGGRGPGLSDRLTWRPCSGPGGREQLRQDTRNPFCKSC
ncbi:hypothetical protein J1605_020571 [Eschrichtius robustus]|uniref:Uncharacterized protein n=1 Tax=Eschrichtius robustus TaxID=9764 RepID=A0AB34HK27_ESCRO|nr:hypothetical protein J1605_020571 [Eschrichtius robustus]